MDLERLIPKENIDNFCETHGCDGVFYVSAKSGIQWIIVVSFGCNIGLVSSYKTKDVLENSVELKSSIVITAGVKGLAFN